MRLSTLIFTFLLLLSSSLAFSQSRPPNILLIVTDDQGSIDLNCYGAKDLVTPHLDSLASRGVRFTQFYAAASVCSPSRAAILTGRFPQRAGLPANGPSQPGGEGVPSSQVTIAEMLKPAGYATAHIGKWHLGYRPDTMPNGQGFDHSFGHMGGCIDNYSHFFYWQGPNRHDLWRNGKEVWHDGQHFGDLMVRECGEFLEKNRDKPFFIYFAINNPHYPLQATAAWREKYAHLPDERRRMYAAFVSTMDERVGQVLAKLDELKLRENTVVIYQADQGHSCEERTFGGGGNAGPYRGAKSSFFEGGIRIPAIVSWPGHLPENQVRTQLATGCDWMPTIAEFAGAPLPKSRIDGRSILPLIKSADAPSPHDAWHWAMGQQWAVRQGDWKLLGNPTDPANKAPLGPDDKLFLANLRDDPGEMKNLAAAHPDIVKRLQSLHREWQQDLQP